MQRRNRKRAAVLAGLALLSLFLLTACGVRDMDGEEWLGFLDGLAGRRETCDAGGKTMALN